MTNLLPMTNLVLLNHNVDTSPLLWVLRSNPQLWNQNTKRTEYPKSPHRELDDIWVRYAPGDAIKQEQHTSDWYPAADLLPVKQYVDYVVKLSGATELGGVLITRQPAGATCYPHIDNGWHAQHYEKFAIQVTSAPGQTFNVLDQTIEPKPGDIFWFDNSKVHWVNNDTEYERITLIISVRNTTNDNE